MSIACHILSPSSHPECCSSSVGMKKRQQTNKGEQGGVAGKSAFVIHTAIFKQNTKNAINSFIVIVYGLQTF